MKKFNLPLTTAISAAILACAGCSSDKEWQTDNDSRVCVDASGNRVPGNQCNDQSGNGMSPYRWYYISRGGYVPYYGYPVGGGSYQPAGNPGSYAATPATPPAGAITRGGFGGIGGGVGGGGGEAAGE